MAACKKVVAASKVPNSRETRSQFNANQFYDDYPSWAFKSSDTKYWPLAVVGSGDSIWSKVLPRLKSFETQSWREIFLIDKEHNHSIAVNSLNPIARKRLGELKIEAESIYSLRIDSTTRLYGYMNGSVFSILWYDSNHGDNSDCVVRSKKKHT